MNESTGNDGALVAVEGVEKVFHRGSEDIHVLKDLHLQVPAGEFLALMGPSGSGKSTLLNLIGGLMTPTTGAVAIEGERVRGPLPKKVAYVFQESALFPWRTVIDNVKLGMAFQGVARSERDDRAMGALSAVGLADFAQHYPAQLSGGMKQRAQLARALGLRTDILLMDEPFAALDEQTRMILGEDLSVLLARTHKTIVFVTHSLGEAVFLADRVAVLTARPGRIKQLISVEEGHPRKSKFMTSAKLGTLRNELYELLHTEIRKTMTQRGETSEGE